MKYIRHTKPRNALPKQHLHDMRGSALLISVIVASALLVVGVEVSMFVTSTIRQARSIDQALVASYAAESGVETALHQIRKEGRTTLRTDTQSTSPLYALDARDAAWTFKKGADIDPEKFTTNVSVLTKKYLGQQEALDLHLYIADDSGFSSVTSRMQDMIISWKAPSTCSDTGNLPWIETTAVTWPLTSSVVQWSTSSVQKNFQQAAEGTQSVTVPLAQLIPPDQTLASVGLSLRIKPFFCALHDVSISFPDKDNPSSLVPIPNYVRIAPMGTFGNAQRPSQVIATQKNGVSGIFDFVLFSEDVVDKKEQ